MTDPLISVYLPVVKGHVVKNYAWMEHRGNCLITVDDLIQIAAIALVKLTGQWDQILADKGMTRNEDGRLFWAYLKVAVKHAVIKYYSRDGKSDAEEFRNESFDAVSDGNTENKAEIRTSLSMVRSAVDWGVILNNLIDYWSVLPKKHKTTIALRYFDNLKFTQMADLLGGRHKTIHKRCQEITSRFRTFVQNQFTDHEVELPRLLPRAWEPPTALIDYIRARYGVDDLESYLGWVTVCLREDPDLLFSMVDAGVFVPAGAYESRALSPFMQSQVDKMHADGLSQREIGRLLGVDKSTIAYHLTQRRVA